MGFPRQEYLSGLPFPSSEDFSDLENSVDCIIHGVAKGQTRLSDFHFHFLKKEMATHSSILAWDFPWTEELGGLQSMGSQRVGQDLVTKQQEQQISSMLKFFCVKIK